MEDQQLAGHGGVPLGDGGQAPALRRFQPIDEPEPISLETLLAVGAPPQPSEGIGNSSADHHVSQALPEIREPAESHQAALMSLSRETTPSSLMSTLNISAENLAVDPHEGGIVKGSGERIELAPKPPSRESGTQTPFAQPVQQMPANDNLPAQPSTEPAKVNAPKFGKGSRKADIFLPEGEFLKMFPDARPD
jgi:hypothetical protein